MISGRQALGSIDEAVRQARSEAAAIDRDIAALTERRLRLHELEGRACRELAMFRLKQPAGGDTAAALSAVEQRARELVNRRADAVRDLDDRIAECERQSAQLTEMYEDLLADRDKRQEGYERAASKVLAGLSETDAYQAQAERTEAASRMATHAEEKTRLAERDREIKGRSYEGDDLFMYLWKRGYGTARYAGGAFARFFDHRVARLIGFDKFRANYSMLQEIPRRLRDHADRLRVRAEAEAHKLDQLEDEALAQSEAAGPATRLAEARQALSAMEERLEAIEKQSAALAEKRADLTSGEDAQTRAAISDMVERLRAADIQELRIGARQTPLPEDDHIVERIASIEGDLEILDRELGKARERQLEQRRRLGELEQVRREYRSRDRDAASWDFCEPRMVSILLAQLLGGALNHDDFWGHMNRRRRAWGARGGWCGGWPGGHRHGRLPRGPRRSRGGGFRTTGSF